MNTKWMVVKFIETKDYSVVIPTNWLVETQTNKLTISTVQYCKWPPHRVTSDDLQCAQDPQESWQQYKIQIVGGNKTYSRYLIKTFYIQNTY